VLAAVSGINGELTLFDLAANKPLPPLESEVPPSYHCAAFSPDGLTLALGGRNGHLALCSLETRQAETTLKGSSPIHALAFTPDGRTLAAGRANGKITLYRRDGDGWQEQAVLEHGALVRSLAFGREGRLLASAGDNRAAVLWDVAGGKQQALLEGHLERVQSVAFTLDGRTLATGGSEGYVALWAIGE
jgi:WD40 repeat protein